MKTFFTSQVLNHCFGHFQLCSSKKEHRTQTEQKTDEHKYSALHGTDPSTRAEMHISVHFCSNKSFEFLHKFPDENCCLSHLHLWICSDCPTGKVWSARAVDCILCAWQNCFHVHRHGRGNKCLFSIYTVQNISPHNVARPIHILKK